MEVLFVSVLITGANSPTDLRYNKDEGKPSVIGYRGDLSKIVRSLEMAVADLKAIAASFPTGH